MKKMKVGIAYEGGNDGEVLFVWLKKIAKEESAIIDNNPIWLSPETGLLGYASTYTKRFISENVDLAVFCTDQDTDSHSRITRLKEKIKNVNESFLEKVAIAVPIPHIEAWLLLQDSVIKNILGLDGSKPLPYENESPKTRFISLYNDSDEYTGSQQQLRIEIANKMDLNYCCRVDNNFEHFVQDLRRIVKLYVNR